MSNPYSDSKILYHAEKLSDIRNGIVSPPIYIRVKPTNKCNHKCYYCSYADTTLNLRDAVNKEDSIPWDILQRTLYDCGDMGVKAITFSGGGEPLVYPNILEAMSIVKDCYMDLSIITNGQNLKNECANILADSCWVRISLDSCNEDKFSLIRGIPKKNFQELINNIKNFSFIKNKDCELGINYVINHQNYEDIYSMAELAKNLGVNHIKFAARITKDLEEYHKPFMEESIKSIQKSKELEDSHFKVVDKYTEDFVLSNKFYRTYHKCPIMQIVTVIAADSKVYPCHDKAYIKGAELGDLKLHDFWNIWDSLGSTFKTFDPCERCNHHCMYDSRNILINKILESNKHRNFI